MDCAITIAFSENSHPNSPNGPERDSSRYTTRPTTTDGSARQVFSTVSTAPRPRKRATPSHAPSDGTLIQVPASDLLDAKARPKQAGALWQVLSKAGVPRYAELVAVGDDPGDAALGYFVLKLMGYADVKWGLPDAHI